MTPTAHRTRHTRRHTCVRLPACAGVPTLTALPMHTLLAPGLWTHLSWWPRVGSDRSDWIVENTVHAQLRPLFLLGTSWLWGSRSVPLLLGPQQLCRLCPVRGHLRGGANWGSDGLSSWGRRTARSWCLLLTLPAAGGRAPGLPCHTAGPGGRLSNARVSWAGPIGSLSSHLPVSNKVARGLLMPPFQGVVFLTNSTLSAPQSCSSR